MFEKLQDFVTSRVLADYRGKPIQECLYNYFMELYRKLNIKNTMASIFLRIREIRTQIDANVFSINYSKQSIEIKSEELKMQSTKQTDLSN